MKGAWRAPGEGYPLAADGGSAFSSARECVRGTAVLPSHRSCWVEQAGRRGVFLCRVGG